VHDIVDLEGRGIPGVYVATVQFEDGGAVQARSLGADPAAVFIPHPVQDRTDEELRALADEALSGILAGLVKA